MRKLLLFSLLGISLSNFAQNVGIGNNDPKTKLDVNGALSLREGQAISTIVNGNNDNLVLPDISGSTGVKASFYRIINNAGTGAPTAGFSILGIVPITGADGQVVTLVNNTGQIMTIKNNASSTSANSFKTLTGADLVSVAGGSSVTIQYNKGDQKWYVTSSQNFTVTAGTINTGDITSSNNAIVMTNNTGRLVGTSAMTLDVKTNDLNQKGIVPGPTGGNNYQVWGTDNAGAPAWQKVNNNMLTNNSITVSSGGAGISVSGSPVALGGTVTVTNTGDTDASNDITNTTSAGGDLTGTYPNPTVARVRGVNVSTTAPANGQVLKYNSGTTQWEPATDNNAGGTVTSVSASAPLFSSGGATPNISLTGTVPVANGGTGVTALSNVTAGSTKISLGGTPTGAVVQPFSIDVVPANIDKNTLGGSVLTVPNGGTGAGTLTGYVYGNGTGAMTASTTIPNSALSGSGNITVTPSGVGLSVSGSPVALGGTVTVTSNATANNTGSTIVARDASGNFTAGTITANLNGRANYWGYVDNRNLSPGSFGHNLAAFGFGSYNNNNTSPYADFMQLNSYGDATGGNDNLVMFNRNAIGMRIYQQTWNSGTAFSTFKDVAFAQDVATGYIQNQNAAAQASSNFWISGNGTYGGGTPETFTSIGSGTYNKTVVYHDATNGYLMERARTTDAAGGTIIDFSINQRGGGTPAFMIKGSGNVGIGIAAPLYKLAVNGTFNVESNNWASANAIPAFRYSYFGYSTTYPGIQLGGGGANQGLFLQYDPTGNTSGQFSNGREIVIGNNIPILAPIAANNNYRHVMTYGSDNKLHIGSQGAYNTYAMNVDDAGNVGIGAATPADRLDVAGNITLSGGAREIRFRNSGGTAEQYVWHSGTSLGMGPGSGSNSVFITSGGNVGVNTTSPNGKFHINQGGAAGVGWGTGFNIGDASNYSGLIQDGGVSRWRNWGTGGYDWYSSGGTQLMALSNAGTFRLTQGSPAAGKILTATNSSGDATWSNSARTTQTTEGFTVGGSNTTFYPVVFNDAAWSDGPMELEIVRSNVHQDVNWWGALQAKFRSHGTSWGHGGDFINSEIYYSQRQFIARYEYNSYSAEFVVWLRGGTSYTVRSNNTTRVTDYGATNKTLTNGWVANAQTTVESYIQDNGWRVSGNINISGKFKSTGISETSDSTYKTNVATLTKALDKVKELRGVTYDWKVDEFPDMNFEREKQLGLIAQEVERIVPEVVETDQGGRKSVEYGHLVPLLIEALKEQQNLIQDQQKQIKTMSTSSDTRFVELEEKINRLQRILEQSSQK